MMMVVKVRCTAAADGHFSPALFRLRSTGKQPSHKFNIRYVTTYLKQCFHPSLLVNSSEATFLQKIR